MKESEKSPELAEIEKQIREQFEKTVTLPFTKKKVRMVAPLWKDRKQIQKIAKENNYDNDQFTAHLLVSCCEVDGVPMGHPDDFDTWPVHDVAFLTQEFENWTPKNA